MLPQQTIDEVLLNKDLQGILIDSIGLWGVKSLGGINKSFAKIVSGRCRMWRVLRPEPMRTIGAWKSAAPGHFAQPFDAASLPEGALAVADTGNNRVQIFSNEQGAAPRILKLPDEHGVAINPDQIQGELQGVPHGLACDRISLFVGDGFKNRVQKLRLADGAHLGTVGGNGAGGARSSGHGEGQFNVPVCLCVAADTLYVCDRDNHRIVVLGTDLSWRYTIGRRGSRNGELLSPTGIAVHDNALFVVEQLNNRVQVFTPDRHGRMRFARAFGGVGDAPGQFKLRPWGLAVVRGGLLVVSEDARLQVLTPHGVPLQVLSLGEGRRPRGVCVTDAHVWTTDQGDHRVHAFKIRSGAEEGAPQDTNEELEGSCESDGEEVLDGEDDAGAAVQDGDDCIVS